MLMAQISEALTEYRAAKLKALDRLGMSARSTALPDNAQIDAAVIRYLQLFGGAAYTERLQRLRTLAPRLMRQLSVFEPRLTDRKSTRLNSCQSCATRITSYD